MNRNEPDPNDHDIICEAEFISEAGAWTWCRCDERRKSFEGMRLRKLADRKPDDEQP